MANTKGSDNPFPSVLFEEHVDPSNPASGFQRLFVDTDHLLKLRDSAGTVTTFGVGNLSDPMTTRGDLIYRNSSNVTARLGRGTASQVLTSDGTDLSWQTPASGFSDPMTTRGDIIIRNASNVTARLGRGSAGQVLTSDGTDVAWAAAAGGGSLSYLTNALSADVNLSSANTYYDGPAVTLSAGTWLLIGSVLLYGGAGSVIQATAKLWDGTTVAASGEIIVYTLAGATTYDENQCALTGVAVVASGTPTWKISCASAQGTAGKILAAAPNNGAGNNASTLVAVKIA